MECDARGGLRQALLAGSHTEHTVDVGGTEIRVVASDGIGEAGLLVALSAEDCVVIAKEEPPR